MSNQDTNPVAPVSSVTPVSSAPGFWSKTSMIQIGYGVWANQLFICLGLTFGFSAVALPQITKEFNATVHEQAFFVSVIALTPPVGSIICGLTIDRLGRRTTLMVSGIPYVVGWIFIGFARKSSEIIIGRTIIGIGVGISSSTVRTFCTEISLPNIRGFVGVMPTQAIALGVTAQAVIGALVKWRTLCYISLGYSTFITAFNVFLPETPYYLLMKGNIEKTKINLRKFRAKDYDIDAELETLQKYKEKRELSKLMWKDYLLSLFLPCSYIPFTIITINFAFAQLAGVTILTFYAVDIQKRANSSVDPYICNVVFGATRFFSGILLMLLIVKLPRRCLAIGSAIVLAAVCVSMGVFFFVYKQPSVVPFVGFTMYVVCATLGYASLPPMLLFELIPLQVRGLLGGIAIALLSMMLFAVNTAYPYMVLHIGFPSTVIGFGISSFSGAVFLYYFLPETKGLSLQEIEERFRTQRSLLQTNK